MSQQSGYVHLEECDVVKETDKAFLIEYAGERHWVPKSQVADADSYAEGDQGVTLSVTKWLADQKGLEGEDE